MKLVARAAAVAAVALCAAAGFADTVGRDGLPLIAGDLSVATDIVHGNAHVLAIGDSIMADISPAYTTQWHPDQWSGVVLGPNYPAGEFSLSQASVSTFTYRTVRSPAGPAGVTTVAPGVQFEYTFNGTAAPSPDPDPKTLASRFLEEGVEPNQLGRAALGNSATGSTTLTPLIYANPNGAANGTTAMSVRINSLDTPAAMLPLNTYAPTANLIGQSVSVPNQVWAAGHYLTADFRVASGAAPAAGSNLILVGLRVSNGGPGLQMASIAQGGFNVEDFINDTATPQANVQQYVSLTDTNVALIAIGTNDLGIDTAATFRDHLQALMDRYRAANPAMKFVLLSTYDLNATNAGEKEADGTLRQIAFDRVMYALSQSNSGTMFLNLYDQAPDWATLNATYLADGTHPNAAGITYFSGQEWNMIAAAAAPEPGLLCLAALVILPMRRRR